MAKDDYFAVVYRVLTYLYACFRQKIRFESATFEAAVGKAAGNEQYLHNVLRMMQDEGYLTGLQFQKAWGNEYLLISELSDAEITQKGIEYLEENGIMQRVGVKLRETTDLFARLIGMLWP